MQEKIPKFVHFSDRCDVLAEKLRLNKTELAQQLGIERTHFSALRNGKSPLTLKSWAKLEAAERKAGIILEAGDATRIEEVSVSSGKKEKTEAKIPQYRLDAHQWLFDLNQTTPQPEEIHKFMDTLITSTEYCAKEGPYLLYLWEELFRLRDDLAKMRTAE